MTNINRSYPAGPSVSVFFTQGVSLRAWDELGMFEREVALYRRLQLFEVNVTFITYGDNSDITYQDRIPGIKICCNRWKLPVKLYASLIPWLHRRALRDADLIKTNQMNGADYALRAARCLGKPLLARCGYLWSKNIILENGKDSLLAQRSLKIEEMVFGQARHIIVTTPRMMESVTGRFPTLTDRVTVIPNYVNTTLFAPRKYRLDGKARFCFVGRLAPEKNLEALLSAVRSLNVELYIVGQGPLDAPLRRLAADNANIVFTGRIPNEELPELFARCTGFILPSFYEGHPKALIEAMACGIPVIGTDVTGINEVITHGETGLLCRTDVDSLRTTIRLLAADKQLQERLGKGAREFVVRNYALDMVAASELAIYSRLLDKEGY